MIELGLRWGRERGQKGGPPAAESADAPTPGSFDAALQAATAARKAAIALQTAPEAALPEAADLETATPEPIATGTDAPDSDTTRDPEIEDSTAVIVAQESTAPEVTEPEPSIPGVPEVAAQPSVPRPDMHYLTTRLQSVLGSRFQVQRPLAIGGMATIFLLQHRLHGGLFVAKVLHPDLATRPGVAAGFRTEAIHAAQLGNHPNAVPVFDSGEDEDLFYLLMPYIEGADLDRVLLKAGPLSREETLHIAAQISSLLCHAESLGIVHGDLTPGNIRLDIYGQYRLLDLGLSQRRGPQDRPYAAGTPLYNSPEQLAGAPLDVRSDLYSLGAVLCECLSNRPAFQADTLEAIHARHRAGDWHVPETLHETDSLRRLLQKLLSVDPAGRPQSAYELSGILHALGWARPEFRPTLPSLDSPQTLRASTPRRRLSP